MDVGLKGLEPRAVQGLDWYKAALKMDSDGDIAHEFLLEPRQPSRKEPPDKKSLRVRVLLPVLFCLLFDWQVAFVYAWQ